MRGWAKTACVLLVAVAGATLATSAAANDLDVVWAVGAGGPGHDKARGITADRDGNVYITGEFTQTAKFGDHTLTSRGDMDFFVAEYNRKGKCLWARSGGGSKTDRGYYVAVDRDQNCYVTGHYQSTDARFDREGPLPNRGGYDVFVAKYDRHGELQWVRTGGGAGYDYGHGIGVDGAGNCYITGGAPGAVEFGDLHVPEEKGSHLFLWKLAPNGSTVWARASRGGSASGQGITVDTAGHSWVTGDVAGDVEFGGAHYSTTGRDTLVVKFDSDGRAAWAAGGTGGKDGIGTGVSVDEAGAVYLGGWFKTTETLGSESMRSAGEGDVFAAKLDPNGKFLWARQGGGPAVDYCEGSIPDFRGGCYVVGCFHDGAVFDGVVRHSEGNFDLYIAHYDASGKLIDFRQAGGPGLDEAYCVVRTGKNEAYVSGAFSGSSRYGRKTLASAGSNDVILAKVRLR